MTASNILGVFFLLRRYVGSLTKDKEKLGILEAETLQLFLLFSSVK